MTSDQTKFTLNKSRLLLGAFVCLPSSVHHPSRRAAGEPTREHVED